MYGIDWRAKWGGGPKTFEEYERKAMLEQWYSATMKDLRAALRETGFRGYSKLDRAELVDAVEADERAREAFDGIARKKMVHYRWIVARGVAGGYAELSEIERAAGVEPDFSVGTRGAYRTWEDVRKVYEAAAETSGTRKAYARVRVTSADGEALKAVLSALEVAGGACTEVSDPKEWKDGSKTWYFDLAISKEAAR